MNIICVFSNNERHTFTKTEDGNVLFNGTLLKTSMDQWKNSNPSMMASIIEEYDTLKKMETNPDVQFLKWCDTKAALFYAPYAEDNTVNATQMMDNVVMHLLGDFKDIPNLTRDMYIIWTHEGIYTDPSNRILLPETGTEAVSFDYDEVYKQLVSNSESLGDQDYTEIVCLVESNAIHSDEE